MRIEKLRHQYPKGMGVFILKDRHIGGSVIKAPAFISKKGIDMVWVVGEKYPLRASEVVEIGEGD